MVSNCVVAALIAWAAHPRTTAIRRVRNRHGRWHFYWERAGRRFEFHAPDRARRSYFGNLLYSGQVRRISGGFCK